MTALVRDGGQAAAVKAALPQVKTVVGNLDSVDILARLSAESDIVLRTYDPSSSTRDPVS